MVLIILCFLCCVLCTISNFILIKKVKQFYDIYNTLKFDDSFFDMGYLKVDDIE